MRRKGVSIAQLIPQGAFQLAGMLSGCSSAGAGIGGGNKAGGRRIGIGPRRTERGRPRKKAAQAAAAADNVDQTYRSETLAGRVSVGKGAN